MYRWVRERHMIGIRGRNFMEAPWAGGIVLLGCVIIAMLLANLPATSLYYRHLLETDLSLMVHSPDGLIDWVFPRGMTVEKLINDGLMVIFFFAVGLEIKREIVCGQLSSAKKALLPVLAAAGGMLFPAIIFTAFNHGTMAANGWGIPTATDIAFAIGILSMLGDRVPVSLKIFLTALAIADDLGAILVIALFYGGQVQIGCLLAALVMTLKSKKASTAVQLLWLLSIATIVWGALTGTWFGLEQAMDVPLLRSLVIPTFANYPAHFGVESTTQQNTIMKFCFILGTVQLSLACVMNIRRKFREKDLSWLADLGWLAAIDALYFVVLYLVIGQQVNLMPVACVVIAGFLLVVLFGGMSPDKSFGQGLKAGLGDAFTVFLNTISAFGNIMSYIRLFAVGMASLAIAQSFNNMALGFKGPLVIAAVLILLIGHGLNIVMGLLSVVVHGVRLNLLEFSGQLGMEWAGIAYDPFKKHDKIKK